MKLSESSYAWMLAVLSAVAGILLSSAVIRGVLSFVDFLSDDSSDFEYTDIYKKVAERSSVETLCDDVVVVSVDGCSRKQIADVIDAVAFMSPAAVGLDLFFPYPSEDGEYLVSAIDGCDDLVLPVAVGLEGSRSFFDGNVDAEYAAVNMISSTSFDIVRDYSTVFHDDSVDYVSMAYALVRKAGYEAEPMDGILMDIWYPSVEFDVVEAGEIVGEDGFPYPEVMDRIRDKIVLVGVVDDPADTHRTPIDDQMPGIMIHAHIIDTMIHDRNINDVSGFWNFVIAFVVCVLFMRLAVFMKEVWDDAGEMVMSVAQLLMMYLFLVAGANLYINHKIFVDFSLTVVVIGVSQVVMSIVRGAIYLYSKYSKK